MFLWMTNATQLVKMSLTITITKNMKIMFKKSFSVLGKQQSAIMLGRTATSSIAHDFWK